MGLALSAFNATLAWLAEDGCVTDGALASSDKCGSTDYFWFRGVWFWNALKLELHLRALGPARAADAAAVGAALGRNWAHARGTLDPATRLSPNDWFANKTAQRGRGAADGDGAPRPSAVGCFKTQMALYWLALAEAGCADPARAARALLYTHRDGPPPPPPQPG